MYLTPTGIPKGIPNGGLLLKLDFVCIKSLMNFTFIYYIDKTAGKNHAKGGGHSLGL